MSQNISSRKQELLSRLKTTLAIVSQATGFDSDRNNGDPRVAEWSSVRDPRLNRRQEASHEASTHALESGSSADSALHQDVAGSSTMSSAYQKFEEIQDEDEFLYGTSTTGTSSGAQVQAPESCESAHEKRSEDREVGRLHWTSQRQVPEEEMRWVSQATRQSQQPAYNDSSWTASNQISDARWSGNTEPAGAMVRTSGQSQWMRPESPKQDFNQWATASQVPRSSNVASDRQQGMQSLQSDAANVRMQPEVPASKLQSTSINSDMLAGILKLVASGGSTPGTVTQQQQQQVRHQQQQQRVPQQQVAEHQMAQQQVPQRQVTQHQYVQNWNPTANVYSQQQMYSQHPDPYGGAAPRVLPSSVPIYTSHLQHGVYASPYPQLYEHQVPPQLAQSQPVHDIVQPGRDMGPLFNQLAAAVLDSNLGQPSSQPQITTVDHMQRLAGLLDQARGGTPPAVNIDPNFMAANQQTLPADRSIGQPSVAANTWANVPKSVSVLSTLPERTNTGKALFPIVESSKPDHMGASVNVLCTEKLTGSTASMPASESDKSDSGQQKGEIDKNMLSQLLNMIGCGSNVTQMMQELIKKDEQEKTKNQQGDTSTPPPSTAAAPAAADTILSSSSTSSTSASSLSVASSAVISSAAPLAQPPISDAQPVTVSVSATVPETALSTANDAKPEPNVDQKPKVQLPEEPKIKEVKSQFVPLSSLSRLQTTYDSGDENTDKGTASAAKMKTSSQPAKDEEWERSTDEFLRRLQSKPGTATSQKEALRSKKGATQQKQKAKPETAKAKEKPTVKSEPVRRTTESEREDLVRGKHEIEGALNLLQKELQNLRTNKKRLLDSPANPLRDAELDESILMERELTDHISQLNNAKAELNQHLDMQSPEKERRGGRKPSRSHSRTDSRSVSSSTSRSSSPSSQRRTRRSCSHSGSRQRDADHRGSRRGPETSRDYERQRRPAKKEESCHSTDRKQTEANSATRVDTQSSSHTAVVSTEPAMKKENKPVPGLRDLNIISRPEKMTKLTFSSAKAVMNPVSTSAVADGSAAGTPKLHMVKTSLAPSTETCGSTFSRDNILKNLQEMVKPVVLAPDETKAVEDIELNAKQKSALELAISMYMAANEFYDGGSLWCRPCDSIFTDITALCRHIHSDQHQLVKYALGVCSACEWIARPSSLIFLASRPSSKIHVANDAGCISARG